MPAKQPHSGRLGNDEADLEMTRLCAEAMDLDFTVTAKHVMFRLKGSMELYSAYYWPLTDDAYCMALVKRFKLHLVYDEESGMWHCVTLQHGFYGRDADLNAAVIKCVANMQRSKESK